MELEIDHLFKKATLLSISREQKYGVLCCFSFKRNVYNHINKPGGKKEDPLSLFYTIQTIHLKKKKFSLYRPINFRMSILLK